MSFKNFIKGHCDIFDFRVIGNKLWKIQDYKNKQSYVVYDEEDNVFALGDCGGRLSEHNCKDERCRSEYITTCLFDELEATEWK